MQANLTDSMKEVSSSGDHSLSVQMVHSVSDTLNEQNIAGCFFTRQQVLAVTDGIFTGHG